MGIEKDYLMRQLMMLFEVIHKILRHRKKGEIEEAEQEIQYFYECLKIDEDVQKLTIEHIELVAFVLKEQGELANEKNNKLNLFRKSYFLLEKIDRESTAFSMDRQLKIAELKEYLN